MNKILCELLDDYLLKDLDAGEGQAFEDHLADCESCRLAIEQDLHVNRLLQAAANIIACPPQLTTSLLRSQQRQVRKRWAKVGSLLASAFVIGLLGWSILSRIATEETPPKQRIAEDELPISNPAAPQEHNEGPHKIADIKPVSPVRIEFPEDVLGLPIDTGEPDITLIQLFPVTNVSETSP